MDQNRPPRPLPARVMKHVKHVILKTDMDSGFLFLVFVIATSPFSNIKALKKEKRLVTHVRLGQHRPRIIRYL